MEGENATEQTCSMLWIRLFPGQIQQLMCCVTEANNDSLKLMWELFCSEPFASPSQQGSIHLEQFCPFAWRRGKTQSLLMPIPAPFLMHPWLQEHPVILAPAENVIILCVSRLPGAANAHGNLCCGTERGSVKQLTSLQTAVRKSIAGSDYVHK